MRRKMLSLVQNDIAQIRVDYRAPLDPAVYGYGPRIDPGGYIYQIFCDGVKCIGGSVNTLDETVAWKRAFKVAIDKGFTDYISFYTEDKPILIS